MRVESAAMKSEPLQKRPVADWYVPDCIALPVSIAIIICCLAYFLRLIAELHVGGRGARATYAIEDIGLIGAGAHQFNYAALNDNGEAAGGAGTVGEYHAALDDHGHITDLGVLAHYDAGNVYGINDAGDIAGSCYKHASGYSLRPTHACLWTHDHVLHDLGALPGMRFSRARAVNNSREVVGQSYVPGDETAYKQSHAFLWKNGAMIDLGVLTGFDQSSALGINDRGQVVGSLNRAHGATRGFVWDHGKMSELTPLPGDDTSLATSINAHGSIVGISDDSHLSHDPHLVLWAGGRIRDLCSIAGARQIDPVKINDTGQIVLNASAGWGREYTYLYNPGKGLTRLRELVGTGSGFDLYKVMGLNNKGQILAGGRFRGGPMKTFILTPIH